MGRETVEYTVEVLDFSNALAHFAVRLSGRVDGLAGEMFGDDYQFVFPDGGQVLVLSCRDPGEHIRFQFTF